MGLRHEERPLYKDGFDHNGDQSGFDRHYPAVAFAVIAMNAKV